VAQQHALRVFFFFLQQYSCQREAYLDHKPYCFDLLERQRDFFRHGAVDGNPYDDKVVTTIDSDDFTISTASLSNDDDNDDAESSSPDAMMLRARVLLDNAKHPTLFPHEKEKLQLQAILQLKRIPLPSKTAPLSQPSSNNNKHPTGVQARVLLAQVYLEQQKKNDMTKEAKRALLQAIRCEVEREESSFSSLSSSSSSNTAIDKQTRDKALESIQRKSSGEDVIDKYVYRFFVYFCNSGRVNSDRTLLNSDATSFVRMCCRSPTMVNRLFLNLTTPSSTFLFLLIPENPWSCARSCCCPRRSTILPILASSMPRSS
jgi:hypothetical protein